MVKQSKPFSKKIGLVTEPIVALKRTIKIKPNQKENIKFSVDKVKGYFPKEYTPTEMQKIIVKLLENYQLKWQKEKELKKYDR